MRERQLDDRGRDGIRRAVDALAVVLVALVTGVFWGTWFTLTRSLEDFDAAEFLHIGKTIVANVALPMRVLLPASLLALAAAAWVHPRKRSGSFYILLAALALMLATLAITLIVEVPIGERIRTWTVDSLPADFESVRLRWKRFHALRTSTSVLALLATTWGALSTWPGSRADERSSADSSWFATT